MQKSWVYYIFAPYLGDVQKMASRGIDYASSHYRSFRLLIQGQLDLDKENRKQGLAVNSTT